MNIVVVTDSLGESAGGLAHATLNLAIATANCLKNSSINILAHQDQKEIDQYFDLPTNLHLEKISTFRNSLFPYSFGLHQCLIDLQPDLVHLRGLWRQGSFASLAWKNAHPGRPLIVQTAGMLEPWARQRNHLAKNIYFSTFESKVLDAADYIHATSTSELQHLVGLGIPDSKIFVIEEGIQLPRLDQSDLRSARCTHPKKLLFVSRIHPKKGLELLIDAIALLRPEGWICQIAGMGDPGYVNRLRQRVDSHSLSETIYFVGPVINDDKDQIFKNASAFILPSFSESFGIAVAEAMSWGLPVVTTTETPWSVLQNKRLGWWVPPKIDEISFALYELFSLPESQLVLMGSQARDYIYNAFQWPDIGSRMSSVYDLFSTPASSPSAEMVHFAASHQLKSL